MLVYIINSSLILVIFFCFYKLFLEKENMHLVKRHYLLGSLVLSYTIPFITFTSYIEVAPSPLSVITDEILLLPETTTTTSLASPEIATNYFPIILYSIYGLVTLIFLLKFVFNLYLVFIKIKNNPKFHSAQFTNVLLREYTTPHTFFNYIFFNKHKFETDQIPKEVYLHEQTHAIQKHSFDILFIELITIFFWFNPFVYLLKHTIKLNHEFLADQAVLNKGIELSTYQNILLSFSTKKPQPTLANAINYSSIKKRFTVMKTHTSKKTIWIKTLILLPLISVLLYSFSQKRL